MKPIKKITVVTAAGAILLATVFSGCTGMFGPDSAKPELPANAESFEMYDTDSADLMFIDVNGRTYAPFGTLKGSIRNSSLKDCLGYVDDDRNDRIYSLCEDPFDNYLVTIYTGGIMDQPVFWRDMATYDEDILTPEYIDLSDEEEWGNSGCYPEMKEFTIDLDLEAEDVYEISMNYKVNGVDCGTSGVRNADKSELKKGDDFTLSIVEISIYQKFDKDGPLDIECTFNVETIEGEMHELDYVYKNTVMLGDKDSLTLTGNAKDGYKIG